MPDPSRLSRQKPAPSRPGRRNAALGIAASLLTLAGCSGGGKSDDSAGGDGGGGGGGGGGSNGGGNGGAVSGNVPPASGVFGGGEGKILFTESSSVYRFDLLSRQLSRLGTYQKNTEDRLAGGITRASNGNFLVTTYSDLKYRSRAWYCDSQGTLIRDLDLGTSTLWGSALSPDGTTIALVNRWLDTSGVNWTPIYDVRLVDVATGAINDVRLIAATDPNAPVRNYEDSVMAQMVWAPDGTLYGLTSIGLYRVDRQAGRSVLLHSYLIGSTLNSFVHPNGREIWFSYADEEQKGTRVGSIDITTGVVTRRSASSSGLDEHRAPCLSPDQQWLLMQDVLTRYTGIGFSYTAHVAAIRLQIPPIDQRGVPTEFRDAAGDKFTANGRMIWY